jgi:hypothetical protein
MEGAMSKPKAALKHEDGAFAIMFVPVLIAIIGFCGLAIDVGMLYNRTVDLTGMAKAVALAAAQELNGTPAGIVSAKAKARETAERLRYQYFGGGVPFTWSDDALSFNNSPSRSGTWTPASSLGANSAADAASLYFAKVDTSGLDQTIGAVDTFFIKIISSSLTTIHLQDTAVAGKTSINVTPLAVCAMSTDKYSVRTAAGPSSTTLSELVQYGFRRGVSYDLMQLNPNGTEPVRFGVNPAAGPGMGGAAFTSATLAPFLCTGTMWVPRLTGGSIRVSPLPQTSPLASLSLPLNSRFNKFTGSICESAFAPPDANIKEYAYNLSNGVTWMNPPSGPSTGRAAAATTTARNKLETVADLPDDYPTPPTSKGDYGPLWAYSRAIKAPPQPDTEPSGGYLPFDASAWDSLYRSGPATLSNYPAAPNLPYQASSGTNGFFLAPTVPTGTVAVRHRRVLNISLLSCSPSAPAANNAPATVLGFGRFFMTVPATDTTLIAEFAGLAAEQSLTGEVRLFP